MESTIENTRHMNSKPRDDSMKAVLKDPEMFVQFLADYVHIEDLKNINPKDVEDVSERYNTLLTESKQSDVVKRIRFKGDDLYVIALVEAESKVNYRMPFKILRYMTLILEVYEKDAESKREGSTRLKDFKYPPIIPIVYYDGNSKWTAARSMVAKTWMGEQFEQYIPKFDYELVELKKYTPEELAAFGNALSLVMFIDRCSMNKDINIAAYAPEGYLESFGKLPAGLRDLLSKIVYQLLHRINMSEEKIAEVTERFDEKEVAQMFGNFGGYDWQKDMANFKEQGRAEGIAEGRAEGRAEGIEKGRAEGRVENMLETAKRMKSDGLETKTIARYTGLSESEIKQV